MKCVVEFAGAKEVYETTVVHNQALLGFFKHVFSNTNYYEKLYSRKGFKPFSSAIRFKKLEILEGYAHTIAHLPLKVYFSTTQEEMFKAFLNSLYNTDFQYRINDEEVLSVKNVECFTKTKVTTNKIKAKTISPVVVKRSDADYSKCDFNDIYLVPGQEGFMKNLNEYTKRRFKHFNSKTPGNISVEPIRIRPSGVPFYSGFVRGFIGHFYLHGEPKTLEFVLNNGLGTKTGAGFGYIEKS